jgi:hypothetical protein
LGQLGFFPKKFLLSRQKNYSVWETFQVENDFCQHSHNCVRSVRLLTAQLFIQISSVEESLCKSSVEDEEEVMGAIHKFYERFLFQEWLFCHLCQLWKVRNNGRLVNQLNNRLFKVASQLSGCLTIDS